MTYVFKHTTEEQVYAYNESTREVLAVGEIVHYDNEAGTYTIRDLATSKTVKIFHTCVYKVGEGPAATQEHIDTEDEYVEARVNELDRLNPNAQEAITECIKEEFLYLARHMLDHADEYFLEEAYIIPEGDFDQQIHVEWVREKTAIALQEALVALAPKD